MQPFNRFEQDDASGIDLPPMPRPEQPVTPEGVRLYRLQKDDNAVTPDDYGHVLEALRDQQRLLRSALSNVEGAIFAMEVLRSWQSEEGSSYEPNMTPLIHVDELGF